MFTTLAVVAVLSLDSVACADPPGSQSPAQVKAYAQPVAARPQRVLPRVEPHPGPSGYPGIAEPPGWNHRPDRVDRPAYQHNFQAVRRYGIGPYHPPRGWHPRRWAYGDILPRPYWAAAYVIVDYWLFSLEIPPAGCEWIRVGVDALLVDTRSGEVLEAVYDIF